MKGLSYEELMDLARANYSKGGDTVYECWDRRTFDEYVKEFGPITKSKALKMFREDRDAMDDMLGWY